MDYVTQEPADAQCQIACVSSSSSSSSSSSAIFFSYVDGSNFVGLLDNLKGRGGQQLSGPIRRKHITHLFAENTHPLRQADALISPVFHQESLRP